MEVVGQHNSPGKIFLPRTPAADIGITAIAFDKQVHNCGFTLTPTGISIYNSTDMGVTWSKSTRKKPIHRQINRDRKQRNCSVYTHITEVSKYASKGVEKYHARLDLS